MNITHSIEQLLGSVVLEIIQNKEFHSNRIKEVQSLILPHFHHHFGRVSVVKSFPTPYALERIDSNIEKCSSFPTLTARIREALDHSGLNEITAETAASQLIRSVFIKYVDNHRLLNKHQPSSTIQNAGIHHLTHFGKPVFAEHIKDVCGESVRDFTRSLRRRKHAIVLVPIYMSVGFPESSFIKICKGMILVREALLPTEWIFEINQECKNTAITPRWEYYLLLYGKPYLTSKVSLEETSICREQVYRSITFLRSITGEYVNTPIFLKTSNIQWIKNRPVVINQNIPWAGSTSFDFGLLRSGKNSEAAQAFRSFNGHILVDPTQNNDFGYWKWAIKQIDILCNSNSAESRVSHLFMAVDALFGLEGKSQTNWQDVPHGLFVHANKVEAKSFKRLLRECYDCRCSMFHEGILPTQRFYNIHFPFMYAVVLETIKWIAIHCKDIDLKEKTRFFEEAKKPDGPKIEAKVLPREYQLPPSI